MLDSLLLLTSEFPGLDSHWFLFSHLLNLTPLHVTVMNSYLWIKYQVSNSL